MLGVALAALIVGGLLGAALAVAVVRRLPEGQGLSGFLLRRPPQPPLITGPVPPPSGEVIDALPVAVAVVDISDDVVIANHAATELGVVEAGRVPVAELRWLVRDARRAGAERSGELDIPAVPGRPPGAVRARVTPVGERGHVALLVEDITDARRVEAVRRDFVANVSHELKTPVGALSVLSEALAGASEDPTAVRRFAGRVQHEAQRLGRLVQELIDLSRLQGADPLPEPALVAVDDVITEALDRARTVAAAKAMELVRGPASGACVLGSESQLVTAVANLLDNAVAYSPERTRVAVAVRQRGGTVDISVTDQGMGIAGADLERVFERFYRADPARSRATGGTGLGLAIVKHIATNHGGSVKVWSVEGSGSTFTLRLPAEAGGERGSKA